VVKTRSLAQDLVSAGHVRLNRLKVTKPGHDVAEGDVLTISLHQRVLVVRVVAFAERRGPYAQARLLYEELADRDDAHAQIGDASAPKTC